MDLSTILTTFFLLISRKITAQSADIVNPGGKSSLTCSGGCNILCNEPDTTGCKDSIFYVTNTVPIWVNCTATRSCEDSVFYYAGSADVHHICHGDGACYDVMIYALNPVHVHCKDHSDGGHDSCRTAKIIDFVPPLSGKVTLTIEGDDGYDMTVFSLYHQGQIYNCINSCDLTNVIIYYGLKFNEYCDASDTSCITAQSLISDTVYGPFTIMDTLSGAYGTSYDYRDTQMGTNVIMALLNDNEDTFYPPVMTDNSTFLSVICYHCRFVTFDLSSVNNVILTGAKMYGTNGATVHGPITSFMVNSYSTLSIYDTTFNLNNFDNVDITINTCSSGCIVNLGNNVIVDVNCAGPGSYHCRGIYMYSNVDPYTSDFTQFDVDCDGTCDFVNYVNIYFPIAAPLLTCGATNNGYSTGCEFLDATLNPTTYTANPTTSVPTTDPTTSEPTTSDPTTANPTTTDPTTSEPTTDEPTTQQTQFDTSVMVSDSTKALSRDMVLVGAVLLSAVIVLLLISVCVIRWLHAQNDRDPKQHVQQNIAHIVRDDNVPKKQMNAAPKQRVVRRIASISHNDDEIQSDSDSDGMYEVTKGAPIATREGNHEKSVDLIGPKVANNEGNNDQINLELVNKVMDTQREGSQSLEEIGITAEGSGQDENVNPGIGASATQGYNAMSVVEGASTAK
eukprot:303576_1